jgi:membrane-bound lytic murein transglycosylase
LTENFQNRFEWVSIVEIQETIKEWSKKWKQYLQSIIWKRSRYVYFKWTRQYTSYGRILFEIII